MEQEIVRKIQELEDKIDIMQQTVLSLRRFFVISIILTVLFFVLPLIVAVIAIPFIVDTFSGLYGGLL